MRSNHQGPVKRRIKNRIESTCVGCQQNVTIAYWDDELESYIYLRDEAICDACIERLEVDQEAVEPQHPPITEPS